VVGQQLDEALAHGAGRAEYADWDLLRHGPENSIVSRPGAARPGPAYDTAEVESRA
jgi:hypothetical protein